MSIRIFNRQNDSTVHFAEVLVHGSSSIATGLLEVSHRDGSFPLQYFEVNGNFFKALVHLKPGENKLLFTHKSGRYEHGRVQIDQVPQFEEFSTKLTLNFEELSINPPVHLCLLVGKNSQYSFDSPNYRITANSNDLNCAVRKLRFAAKLISAFMEEQFHRAGFGPRGIRFAEKNDYDTITAKLPDLYQRTVTAHIVRLDKTVEEIRDPANNDPAVLSEWAAEALQSYGNPFFPGSLTKAACIYIDAHWIVQNQETVGSAFGYRVADDKSSSLFVMGSQAIWAFPQNYEDLYASFSETFPVDTNQVANQFNTSGTPWEAANTALGFLALALVGLVEPGLRDYYSDENGSKRKAWYYYFSRLFMTKEFYSARTSQPGFAPVLASQEFEVPRNVLVRLLFTNELRLLPDYEDPSLPQEPLPSYEDVPMPRFSAIRGERILFTAKYGVSSIELVSDDDSEEVIGNIEFLPRSCNGNGPPKEVAFTYYQLEQYIYRGKQTSAFRIKVYGIGSRYPATVYNPLALLKDYWVGSGEQIGLQSLGQATFFHTPIAGGDGGHETPPVFFYPDSVYAIRVYYGDYVVHGFRIFTRNPSSSRFHRMRSQPDLLFGEENEQSTDVQFAEGELLVQVRFHCGAWIDGVQFVSSRGDVSPWFGYTEGGHYEEWSIPPGYLLVGFRGRNGAWLDGLGGVYIRTAN